MSTASTDLTLTLAPEAPVLISPPPAARTPLEVSRYLSILGVRITDVSQPRALQMLEDFLLDRSRCHSVFFVNAHTLNVSADEPDFRHVLNAADCVFNDGTGARWAARQRGVHLRANLNGTDLVPDFFAATAGRGYRYFLLGADKETIARAAVTANERFSGWRQVGHHHGYVHGVGGESVIERINASEADMLLVGMGNPLQERWIQRYKHRLRVPLAIAVGGLFDHWGGNLRRAPHWVRRLGCEWMGTLAMQPYKWRRYLLGNPKFLYRITRALADDRAAMQSLNRG